MIHLMRSYYITQAVAGIFSACASIIAVSVGPVSTGECADVTWVRMY